jgi:hypothetical protein
LAGHLGTTAVATPAVPTSLAAAQAQIAKHKKKHHKHKKHHHKPSSGSGSPSGPSVTVLGFGVNHLYVADDATVTSAADCSTAVQGNGYPIGPPQNIYFEAYVKGTDIPADAPTQIAFDYPEGEGLGDEEPTLGPAAPWSTTFGASTFGFGNPPGSQTNVFRFNLGSGDDQNGPAASDFDGTYTFTVSVVVGSQTLTSTATATVDC